MAQYSDNSEEVLDWWDAAIPARSIHVLEEVNNTEYAQALHEKSGYYVFNPSHLEKTLHKHLQAVVNAGLPLNDTNVHLAMMAAGYEDLDFLKSTTSEMRPPVRASEGPRAAHPGHWADRTASLIRAFRATVNNQPIE